MLVQAVGRINNGAIPPKAVVRFEAVTLMVDEWMRWEKANRQSRLRPSAEPCNSACLRKFVSAVTGQNSIHAHQGL